MAAMSRLFEWRGALVTVKPDTLVRWHRKEFRLFWRWKSKPECKIIGSMSVLRDAVPDWSQTCDLKSVWYREQARKEEKT
jgi:hypothetical protein